MALSFEKQCESYAKILCFLSVLFLTSRKITIPFSQAKKGRFTLFDNISFSSIQPFTGISALAPCFVGHPEYRRSLFNGL